MTALVSDSSGNQERDMVAAEGANLLTELGSDLLRTTYGRFPSGIVAVCAEVDGSWQAMVASSFVSVSLDPPLVAFCPQNSSATWPKLARAPRLGVSVIGHHQSGLARSMAAKEGDRFADARIVRGQESALLPQGASAWLETTIEQSMPAGDHQIVLLRVHGVAVHEHLPAVFHQSRFQRVAD